MGPEDQPGLLEAITGHPQQPMLPAPIQPESTDYLYGSMEQLAPSMSSNPMMVSPRVSVPGNICYEAGSSYHHVGDVAPLDFMEHQQTPPIRNPHPSDDVTRFSGQASPGFSNKGFLVPSPESTSASADVLNPSGYPRPQHPLLDNSAPVMETDDQAQKSHSSSEWSVVQAGQQVTNAQYALEGTEGDKSGGGSSSRTLQYETS